MNSSLDASQTLPVVGFLPAFLRGLSSSFQLFPHGREGASGSPRLAPFSLETPLGLAIARRETFGGLCLGRMPNRGRDVPGCVGGQTNIFIPVYMFFLSVTDRLPPGRAVACAPSSLRGD